MAHQDGLQHWENDRAMTKTSTLAAALWDFDGTLVDTEPLWLDAEFDLIANLGGTWSIDHADQLIGNSLLASASYILNTIGRHDLSPGWVVDELILRVIQALSGQPIPWRPGARELLESFAAAAVPCALVSASYRVMLDAVLNQLPADIFAVSVAGDEVQNGKPHPEPYETAAAALGVDTRQCVVLEDSITGASSGNAAGALVVAVPSRVPIPPAPRRRHVTSLSELDAAAVAEWLEQANGQS
jgi:HAD superfamily hydrolase (TIGR01509 family)